MRRLAPLVVALFAVSPSAALACDDPSLGGVTASAGAGDTVSFSAVHLDAGASYSLTVGGRSVADGTAGGGTIAGAFTMPDLGSAGVYYVELRVAHEDGTWVSTQPIRFSSAVPPPASTATLTPAPKTQTAPVRKPVTVSPNNAPVEPKPVAPATPAVAAVRKIAHPAPAAVALHRKHGATKPRRTVQPAPIHSPQTAPSIVHLRAEPGASVGPPEPPVASSPHEHRGFALWLLSAFALVLIAGLGAFLARQRARDVSARAHELEVDAELQELVAEARAKEEASLRY